MRKQNQCYSTLDRQTKKKLQKQIYKIFLFFSTYFSMKVDYTHTKAHKHSLSHIHTHSHTDTNTRTHTNTQLKNKHENLVLILS